MNTPNTDNLHFDEAKETLEAEVSVSLTALASAELNLPGIDMMAKAYNSLSGKPPSEVVSAPLFKFTALKEILFRSKNFSIPSDTYYTN